MGQIVILRICKRQQTLQCLPYYLFYHLLLILTALLLVDLINVASFCLFSRTYRNVVPPNHSLDPFQSCRRVCSDVIYSSMAKASGRRTFICGYKISMNSKSIHVAYVVIILIFPFLLLLLMLMLMLLLMLLLWLLSK